MVLSQLSTGGLDDRKELGDVLNFIECDPSVKTGNESVWISLSSSQNAGVVKGEILAGVSSQLV